MTGRRLAAVDAQTYWMSAKIPSDQFLLYGFADEVGDLNQALRRITDRARACSQLRLRIRDRGAMRYPEWVSGGVEPDQLVVHACGSWSDCLDLVALLDDKQLDPAVTAWRLHVFPSVAEMPGVGTGTVAVVQVAHALGDGIRSSALAAWLFGRAATVDPVEGPARWEVATLPWRSYIAARTHRRLMRETLSGVVPAPADSRPALRTNARPDGTRRIRTLVRQRSEISGPTVTVGVLGAVSAAMAGHLRDLGEDPSLLGAEVPMAKAGPRHAHNHFGNVGVGLYPELSLDERMSRIAADLAERRRRAAHPAMVASNRAFAAVPASLLRWGIGQFDPTHRSPTVTGNTVVSSVNRGPADLYFGDAPVAFTAGYPGLSPMMGLTHGVHGIGDTIAISVHAAESAVDEIDAYVKRLTAAIDAH